MRRPLFATALQQIALSRIAFLLCLLATSCALDRLHAVPATQEEHVTVAGMNDIRFWGDESSPELIRMGVDAYYRELAAHEATGETGPLPSADFLAISGGGGNGAFGAGLLAGWTQAGKRPNFKMVTGISTGALIAPFAFLGPRYDTRLKEVYTTISSRDVLERRWFTAAILSDALADNAPLRRTIARYVDQPMFDEIAAEYAKGRLLLIGTTNLDARRPVIWNIGQLAASHNPRALQLFRDILVASAAIPGAFPPTMIQVEAGGKTYEEMHVDGGATSQVFTYPPGLDLAGISRENRIVRDRHLYVIRNARLDPEWANVDRRTLSITGRAISSLIQTQGVGDLYRIYLAAHRDDIDFNLAYIPSSFDVPLPQPFDTHYMNELFKLGYELAVKGYPWAKVPPGFTAPETLPESVREISAGNAATP